MNAGTAKFAVYAYGDRNLVCHSKSMQRKTVGDWSGLAQQISEDLQQLRDVLRDDQLEHETDWRRIIGYFRDRHIRQDPEGNWERIPNEAFSDGLCQDPSRPIDVRYLPDELQQRTFHTGDFRDSDLPDPQPAGRRVAAWSDPTADGKRKRDEDSSQSVASKPSAKARSTGRWQQGSRHEGDQVEGGASGVAFGPS